MLNKDGILHNIHACDEKGSTLFNFAQPAFKKTIERQREATGVINPKCDVHLRMNAYVVLLDNARYTISDEQGRFRLGGCRRARTVSASSMRVWAPPSGRKRGKRAGPWS